MFQGIHEYDIPRNLGVTYGLMWVYIMQVIYNPILALVKSSILLFLLRLGAGLDPFVLWTIHGVNAWNIGQGIATFLVVVFQCTPPAYYWLQSDPTSTVRGTCIQEGYFYVITAGLSIFTDIIVLALPIRIFSRLQLKLKLRVALIGLFCLGAR